MKVLHVSTWKTRCGIAAYAEKLVEHLTARGIQNQAYGISPHDVQAMLDDDVKSLVQDILRQAEGHDLVHVQHEFSFFGSGYPRSLANFGRLLSGLKRSGKAVVTTFH